MLGQRRSSPWETHLGFKIQDSRKKERMPASTAPKGELEAALDLSMALRGSELRMAVPPHFSPQSSSLSPP